MHVTESAHLHCELCGWRETVALEDRITATRDHLGVCEPSKEMFALGLKRLRQAEDCAVTLGGDLEILLKKFYERRADAEQREEVGANA